MNYVFVAPNTTWCPYTPENWRNFNRLKAALNQRLHPTKRPRPHSKSQPKPIIFYGFNTVK